MEFSQSVKPQCGYKKQKEVKITKCPRCGYEFEVEIKESSKETGGEFEKIVDTSTSLPDYP
ncbi:hypothetical protein A3K64_01945 [Candidatus Micrarchaeota archaeon RBG_16_36_9]|nr:MAG: hypothetical protein A3K64_01945 [Candidatus Micrarchaeota archaeon RBG_16_36_9]